MVNPGSVVEQANTEEPDAAAGGGRRPPPLPPWSVGSANPDPEEPDPAGRAQNQPANGEIGLRPYAWQAVSRAQTAEPRGPSALGPGGEPLSYFDAVPRDLHGLVSDARAAALLFGVDVTPMTDDEIGAQRVWQEGHDSSGRRFYALMVAAVTDGSNDPAIRSLLEHLCSGAGKIEPYEGRLYNGDTLTIEQLKSFKPGERMRYLGPLAATTSLPTAKRFAAKHGWAKGVGRLARHLDPRQINTIFEIRSESGRPISFLREDFRNQEVLFLPDTQFEVVEHHVKGLGSRHYIVLQEVEPSPYLPSEPPVVTFPAAEAVDGGFLPTLSTAGWELIEASGHRARYRLPQDSSEAPPQEMNVFFPPFVEEAIGLLEMNERARAKGTTTRQLHPVLIDGKPALASSLGRQYAVFNAKPGREIMGPTGGGITPEPEDIFDTLSSAYLGARLHQAGDGGEEEDRTLWIYAFDPGSGEGPMAGVIPAAKLMEAFRVVADGTISPDRPSNHRYNDVLELPGPTDLPFPQGGVISGAQTAETALVAAVTDAREPSVVISAGFLSDDGSPRPGGLTGAAAAARSLRIYTHEHLQSEIRITFVLDRRQLRVMKAALEGLGENISDYKFEILSGATPIAPVRARFLLKTLKPDLMLAVNLPGRTQSGGYFAGDGHPIRSNAGRDEIFRLGYDAHIPIVAMANRGNEVGTGHPDLVGRVRPPAEIASVIPADAVVTGPQTTLAAFAWATEMLRRAKLLNLSPRPEQIAAATEAVLAHIGRQGSSWRYDEPSGIRSIFSKVSPRVDAAFHELLVRQARQPERKLMADWTGLTVRIAASDSGFGVVVDMPVIERFIRELTGAHVQIIGTADLWEKSYGTLPGGLPDITEHAHAHLVFLDELAPDGALPCCNTFCIEGLPEYGKGVQLVLQNRVPDLIASTRDFHRTLTGDGKLVVAFSTDPTARAPLSQYVITKETGEGRSPPFTQGGVYRDTNVIPVGGTEQENPGHNLADIINQAMARPTDERLQQHLHDLADYYLDKILRETDGKVDIVSFCCTHYPYLKAFLERSLAKAQAGTLTVDGRPQSVDPQRVKNIEFLNPIEFQVKAWIREVAEIIPTKPSVGINPRRLLVTTAPEDPEVAARRNVLSLPEVAAAFPIAMQDPGAVTIGAGPKFTNVDTERLRMWLDQPEPMDAIDALQAFTPTEDGKGASIRIPGSARKAASELRPADHVLVLSGFPVPVGSNIVYEPEGTVAAVTIAAAQVKLGKRVTLVTPTANLDALRAGLDTRGLGEQVAVRPFDAMGEGAAEAAKNLLDEFQPPGSYIPVIGLGDVGNEAGGGAVALRVPHVRGQAIASAVAVDTFVTGGAVSWAANAVVAAQMRYTGSPDLLPVPAEMRQLWEAVVPASVHGDEQLEAELKTRAAVYNPTVHAGMVELAQHAAHARSREPNGGFRSVAPTRSAPANSGHVLAIVAAAVPGRDLGGEYWTSAGENITPHVVPLDDIVREANRRNVAARDTA
jgi:hypothetical protein